VWHLFDPTRPYGSQFGKTIEALWSSRHLPDSCQDCARWATNSLYSKDVQQVAVSEVVRGIRRRPAANSGPGDDYRLDRFTGGRTLEIGERLFA